jgi:hypothetical protein
MLLLVAVAFAAFAGTCVIRNVRITVIDDHDTYGAELFNDSGADILQHKFVVAFLNSNNQVVDTIVVDGCLRSLQNGETDFYSATSDEDSDTTTNVLSRLALDSTLKLGQTADGDFEFSAIVVSRNGETLTVTGTLTNRDSDDLVDPVVCAVVRDDDGNVVIVERDTTVGDGNLDDNEAGAFSITITVPDDDNIVNTVDLWADGLDGDDDEDPVDPESDLDNAVSEHGSANKLAYTTQPSAAATGGTNFAAQPVVEIRDSNNNRVVTSSANVTLALNTVAAGPNGAGTLVCDGGLVKAAVNGIATFAGCDIDKAGTYTITATSSGLTQVVSNNIVVSTGAAAKLAFTTAPSTPTGTGVPFGTQPVVQVQDAGGNPINASTAMVALGLNAVASGGGTLNCDANTVAANGTTGSAIFAGCDIVDADGGTYTITASSAGVTSATTGNLVINP